MDYHFIKCQNPRFITNRWTGKTILAECGKCECCLLKKNVARKTRCQLENLCHEFCYFVTLTYTNEYLPLMCCVEKNKDSNIYNVFRYRSNYSYYDKELKTYSYSTRYNDGEWLGKIAFKDYISKVSLSKKCNISSNPNVFPCVDMSDIQLFLKRLRKKITNEKIRYFYCSEYGPVHFRPHFHLLLWFDQEKTSANIIQDIHSSWPFGRVDVSLSKGKSISYTSSYVNSHMYLPDIFRLRQTSPKSHHSWYLGDKIFTHERKITSETDFERIVHSRIVRDGFNSDVVLWRSLKSRLAPKCKGYNSKSEYERVLSYSLNAMLRDWTQETSPLYQARFIRDYVELFDFYSPDEAFNEVLQYFRSECNYYESNSNITKYVIPSITDFDKFERSVYKELLTSRYFLSEFCDGDDSFNNVSKKVKLLDKFYNYLDYENLKKQLQLQQDFYQKSNTLTKFFHHNMFDVEELKAVPEYKRFTSSRKTMYSNYVKHKELNDLNKIFVYG